MVYNNVDYILKQVTDYESRRNYSFILRKQTYN